MSMPTDNGRDFFVNDFYRRTLQILNAYEGKYDVTLLLNSMLGLLVVPKERFFESKEIPDDFINTKLLEQIRKGIKINLLNGKNNPNNSLKEIVRHLRNAVSHGRLTVIGEEPIIKSHPVLISSVNFVDKGEFRDRKTKQLVTVYFEAELGIELLRSFLIDFATHICNDSKLEEGCN